MNSFEYNGQKIEYEVEKSKRKTISIRVSADGVVVRAPRGISASKLQQLVLMKAEWIVEKLKQMKELEQEMPQHLYEEGEVFLYQGTEVKLAILEGRTTKVSLEEDRLCLQIAKNEERFPKEILENWYRQRAKEKIKERVEYYLKEHSFGKVPNRIVIKDQKSRWGSCSSKGNLNFNYRLIMAPSQVLDYVVVHELCHFLHMNHSPQFWACVEEILPDYKSGRDWLKKYGKMLTC